MYQCKLGHSVTDNLIIKTLRVCHLRTLILWSRTEPLCSVDFPLPNCRYPKVLFCIGASMFRVFTNYQYFLQNPNFADVKMAHFVSKLRKIFILARFRPLHSYTHKKTDSLTDRCLFSQIS